MGWLWVFVQEWSIGYLVLEVLEGSRYVNAMCWAVLNSFLVLKTLVKGDHLLGVLLVMKASTEGTVVVAGQRPTTALSVIHKATSDVLGWEKLWCGEGVGISRGLSGRLYPPNSVF